MRFKEALVKILLMIVIIFSLFGIKMVYEFAYSPFQVAMRSQDNLVVFYRPRCSRCHHVALRVLSKNYFSIKRTYYINANRLDNEELKQANLTITPGFRYHGKTIQTVKGDEIDRIINASK